MNVNLLTENLHNHFYGGTDIVLYEELDDGRTRVKYKYLNEIKEVFLEDGKGGPLQQDNERERLKCAKKKKNQN